MSTLKELYGKTVKVLSTDPTDAGAEGQVWYNTTSGAFKTVLATGAWSSGGAVNAAGTTASAGTQTANVIFAGQRPGNVALVEEYNGSSWSEVNNYPISVGNLSGTGTQTAALGFGGYPNVTTTNEYDGTNWTSGGALGTGRELLAGIGVQTAALAAGGLIRGSP